MIIADRLVAHTPFPNGKGAGGEVETITPRKKALFLRSPTVFLFLQNSRAKIVKTITKNPSPIAQGLNRGLYE